MPEKACASKVFVENIPEHDGSYKVLQADSSDKRFLFFGTLGLAHTQIVKEFAEKLNVPLERKITERGSLFFPAESSDYRIVGMGWCDVKTQERRLHFRGCSVAYMLELERNHLSSYKGFLPKWTITIED